MESSYVIGGPCVEMYVRSYNQVSHSVGSSSLEMFFSTSKSSASYYGYAFNSDSYASSAIDTKGYNSLYYRKGDSSSGGFWIASPPSNNTAGPYCIFHNSSLIQLSQGLSNQKRGISLLISLKSDFIVKI